MRSIGLIDYGAGNFTSVRNALTFAGIEVVAIATTRAFSQVDRVILPGVGSFAGAMRNLDRSGLIQAIEAFVQAGHLLMGICVGMQILGSAGFEFEEERGLGLISGSSKRLAAGDAGLRLPHIGWNELQAARQDPLVAGLSAPPTMYFLHSYELIPDEDSVIVASAEYGGPVVAVVRSENVMGVQFHPEKSQRDGLRLLRNFASLDA